MQKVFHHIGENEIASIVEAILSVAPMPRILLLEGDLGAGKTTLVRSLVKALGSSVETSSPTFSLINEYPLPTGKNIVHSDWYRIRNIEELYDSGMMEYIDSNDLLIIEWPEIGMNLLHGENHLKINIAHENNSRTYTLEWFNS